MAYRRAQSHLKTQGLNKETKPDWAKENTWVGIQPCPESPSGYFPVTAPFPTSPVFAHLSSPVLHLCSFSHGPSLSLHLFSSLSLLLSFFASPLPSALSSGEQASSLGPLSLVLMMVPQGTARICYPIQSKSGSDRALSTSSSLGLRFPASPRTGALGWGHL